MLLNLLKNKMLSLSYHRSTGSFMVIGPMLIIVFLSFSAIFIDTGMSSVARAQLRSATDAAATAGVGVLANGHGEAIQAATDAANQNSSVGNIMVENVVIEIGFWDKTTKTFTPNDPAGPPGNIDNAVRVTAEATPSLLMNQLISKAVTVRHSSIATLATKPRDIVLVLDVLPVTSRFSRLEGYTTLPVETLINNLQAVYTALNLPQLGNMVWTPQLLMGSNASIITALGLNSVSYPYPGGSWNNYVNYVKTNAVLAANGYANRYGYLTFVNYLQTRQFRYADTPELWKTPQEPLTTMKNSIVAFFDTLTADDRVVLFLEYGGSSNQYVPFQLQNDTTEIKNLILGNIPLNRPGRQAGHIYPGTDVVGIAGGIWFQLNLYGREEASWTAVFITPAQLSAASISNLKADVNLLKLNNDFNDHKITLHTIVVDPSGDSASMQEVAAVTGGTNTVVTPMTLFDNVLENITANYANETEIVE